MDHFTVNKVELFVPGRVCFIGEHTDWASCHERCTSEITDGRCLVFCTPMGLHTRAHAEWVVEPIDDSNRHDAQYIIDHEGIAVQGVLKVETTTPDGVRNAATIPLNTDLAQQRARESSYFSYIYGVVFIMMRRYGDRILCLPHALRRPSQADPRPLVATLTIYADNYKTDLPIKKGLSSSAACCVTFVRMFAQLFDIPLDIATEMELAYEAEILTGSECGRLDQVVAYGQSILDIAFKGPKVDVTVLTLPDVNLHFVVADLLSSKDTRKILHELHSCYPNHNNDPLKRNVQRFLGQISLDFVQRARDALFNGDAAALGQIYQEYQKAFDENLSPVCDELRSIKLHRVINDPSVRALSCGAKGVGSQGDGSVQFICQTGEDQKALCALLESSHLNCHAIPFTIG